MKNLYKISVLVLVFLSFACASQRKTQWISVGPSFSRVKYKSVEVYKTRAEIKRLWETIGFYYGDYIPESDREAIKAEIDNAIKTAARNGAEAIIIRESKVTEQSSRATEKHLKTPHVYIYAIAVKYADNLTEKDKDAIEKWKTSFEDLRK